MAVFPDKIILKHSGDSDENLIAALATGGYSEIQQGELVIARGVGYAKLFTKDSMGDVVEVTDTEGVTGSPPAYKEASVLINRDTGYVDKTPDTDPIQYLGSTAVVSSADPATGDGYTTFAGGVDDYFYFDLEPEVIGTRIFTLEFWYRSTFNPLTDLEVPGVEYRQIINVAGNDQYNQFQIANCPNGGNIDTANPNTRAGAIVFCNRRGDPEGYITGTAAINVNDGQWHFIAISHEGAGYYSTFVDGELAERRQNTSGTITGPNGETYPRSDIPNFGDPLRTCLVGVPSIYLEYQGEGTGRFVGDLDGISWYFDIAKYSSGDSFRVPGTPGQEWAGNIYIPTIDVIADVNTSGYPLEEGDSLIWNEQIQSWVPGSPGVQQLANLTDVDLDSLANNDVLVYDSTDQLWKNGAAPGYDVSSNDIQDLGNVETGTPQDGQILKYNSSNNLWEFAEDLQAQGLAFRDLTDIYGISTSTWQQGSSQSWAWISSSNPAESSPPRKVSFSQSSANQTVLEFHKDGSVATSKFALSNDFSDGRVSFMQQSNEGSSSNIFQFGVNDSNGLDSGRPAQIRLYTGKVRQTTYTAFMPAENTLESVQYRLPPQDGNDGDSLITDGAGNLSWISRSSSPPTGVINSESNLTSHPLNGIDGLYGTRDQMIADSWTYIEASEERDDAAVSFTIPNEFAGVYYGTNYKSQRTWFINTNGGLGWDASNTTTTSRAGNVFSDATSIDFYVGLWSQDTKLKRAGTKVVDAGGRLWLIVRMDFYLPADVNLGIPVECWFSADGDISIRYGTCENPGFFLTGSYRNAFVSNGSTIATLLLEGESTSEFHALNGLGQYVFNSSAYSDDSLNGLSDVDLVTNPPEPGEVLTWDGLYWVPKNPAYSEGGDGGDGGVVWINDLADVNTEIVPPSINDYLGWDGYQWTPRTLYVPSTINNLSDVDTVTNPPEDQDSLVWDADNLSWVPGIPKLPDIAIDQLTDVDTSTKPPEVNQALVWDGNTWVPGDGGGSGGSSGGTSGQIAGTTVRVAETQTSNSQGEVTLTEVGQSGQFVNVSSSAPAWITYYSSLDSMQSDSARSFGQDPGPSAGVLAEFYLPTGSQLRVTPATFYFNDDTVPADALYAKVRDLDSNPVICAVTTTVYAHQTFAGYGTNRVTDSTLTTSGFGTIDGIGQSGQLISLQVDVDSYVTLYTDKIAREDDLSRNPSQDPAPGSGVIFHGFLSADVLKEITPGAPYANNDPDPTSAIYLYVRDTNNTALSANVITTAYAETNYTAISGGTFGSG